MKSRLQLEDIVLPSPGYFFSAFTWPRLPVIVAENGVLASTTKQWGLIPAWCKDEAQAMELRRLALNAKGETAAEKPMFRRAFQQRRCIIPAAGFFEWRDVNRKKYPYYIQSADIGYLLFGGIWESWTHKETGEVFETFCIITTAANKLLSMIHNTKLRMPLVLTDEEAIKWISESESSALELIKPCADSLLKAHTISKLVSNPRAERNVPEVQQPFSYPELEQKLFG